MSIEQSPYWIKVVFCLFFCNVEEKECLWMWFKDSSCLTVSFWSQICRLLKNKLASVNRSDILQKTLWLLSILRHYRPKLFKNQTTKRSVTVSLEQVCRYCKLINHSFLNSLKTRSFCRSNIYFYNLDYASDEVMGLPLERNKRDWWWLRRLKSPVVENPRFSSFGQTPTLLLQPNKHSITGRSDTLQKNLGLAFTLKPLLRVEFNSAPITK